MCWYYSKNLFKITTSESYYIYVKFMEWPNSAFQLATQQLLCCKLQQIYIHHAIIYKGNSHYIDAISVLLENNQ